MDAVYEPLRRWGSKTGVFCVWAICVDGRKVLLTLSTANSESYESCLEVLRDLVKRGLQTPVTITTDGAPGADQSDRCDLAQSAADSLLVSQDAEPPAESAPASVAGVQGLSGRYAGCPDGARGRAAPAADCQPLSARLSRSVSLPAGRCRQPVSITSPSPSAINSMSAPPTWPSAPLQRSGAGPRSFRTSGTRGA